MKVSIGQSKKRYTHRLNRDVNTTLPFGIVQPLFKQMLTPDDTVKVSSKQLVRLAPLVVPSFARVGLYTTTRFVPLIDVVPYADALFAKQPYYGGGTSSQSFIPKTLPFTTSALLTLHLLNHSNYTVYQYDEALEAYSVYSAGSRPATITFAKNMMNSLFSEKTSVKSNLTFVHLVEQTDVNAYINMPNFENADYIVFSHLEGDLGSHPTYAICFNFGTSAKTLRNIFLGLGYSCDFDDYDKVSIVPLLSFYKAWFDTYGLTRTKNFTNTKCFELIKVIEAYNVDFSHNRNDASLNELFGFFIDSLTECFYASPVDYVTLHRPSLQNVKGNSLTYVGAHGQSAVVAQSAANSAGAQLDDPHIDVVAGGEMYNPSISSVTLRVLQSLSRFVNKNSVLGQNISKWMKVKFGASVVNTIFEESNKISASYMPFNINDVFSTSDTAQGSGKDATGEHLGAYAGKGIGSGSLDFSFTAPCHGFVITLACVASDSNYFQGNDPTLFALDYNSSPNADFDALGMEVTSRSVVINHNSISNRALLPVSDITDNSFGFVPRYTGFKVSKNVVNGDMSRRGSIDSMSPYYLDKILTSSQVVLDKVDTDGNNYIKIDAKALPSSDYDWRFLAHFPYLGNFNRLFIQDVGPLDKGSYLSSSNYKQFCLDDPYLCQCIFNVSLSNKLKPISMSFDTFSTEDDTSTDVSLA